MENYNSVFATLDQILAQSNIKDVTTESAGFDSLPDGYYLCEVEKAEIKETKETHLPMISMQLKIVDDGMDVKLEDNNEITRVDLKGTKNRKIFKNYVIKDESSLKRFVSDMLKFEGEVPGQPLLEKEYFMNSEILEDALDIIEGMRIYVQSTTTKKQDGTMSNWQNFISWKRVEALELPQ